MIAENITDKMSHNFIISKDILKNQTLRIEKLTHTILFAKYILNQTEKKTYIRGRSSVMDPTLQNQLLQVSLASTQISLALKFSASYPIQL